MHWPWCASKCPYCDFNSYLRRHAASEGRPSEGGPSEAGWLCAIRAELDHRAALAPGHTVETVFFGGGTPSLMAPGTVGAVLDHIAGLWTMAPGAEVTLEANPSSVEAEHFAGYRAAGVNRVSLGIQALDDGALAALGRRHNMAEALSALGLAKRRFERVSFDLIYARPNQSVAEWRAELSRALALAHGHLSLYQLTIETGTPFASRHARGRLAIPDPENAEALFEVTQELTEAAGLPAYEISNHAASGEQCRHNLIYWRAGDYAGVGPGAHGRLTVAGARLAHATEHNPRRWAELVAEQGHGIVETMPSSPETLADEMLLMGLRLREGVDIGDLAARTGLAPRSDVVGDLERAGFLHRPEPGHCLAATARGRMVTDRLVLELSSALAPLTPSADRQVAKSSVE